jgi:arabinogalactan oligomer / maltooligosaccharide transport system permease protein
MAIETTAVRSTADDTTPRPGGIRPARRRRSRLASVGLHAGLITASFIAVFPVLWVLVTSFKPTADAYSTAFIRNFTFANYSSVLDSKFPRWFLNSVIVAMLTMALGVFISATCGYAMSRFRFPAYRPLMWFFLVTQMFPVAILIVPIYNIMSSLGLIDTHWSLIVAYCTVAVPFCSYLLKGYFDTIPIGIDEAGRVDGLNPFGTFWRLILPLARPGLAVTAFYTFLTAWGEVAYASRFMTSEDNYTLAFGMQVYVGQFKTEWGDLAAASMMVTIPALVVFYVVQKYLVSGLTAGGTKG